MSRSFCRCSVLALIAFALLLASSEVSAGQLAKGNVCRLSAKIVASRKSNGRGGKVHLDAGSQVVVKKLGKRSVKVEHDGRHLFIKHKVLARVCASPDDSPIPTPEPEVPPADDVPADDVADAPESVVDEPPTEPEGELTPTDPDGAQGRDTAQEGEQPSDDARTRIAVMAVRGSDGLSPEFVKALTAAIPEALDALGAFKTISSDDIQQMLAMESLKQTLGCDDMSCLAEIGGAIGADFMITGSVLMVGEGYLLQFQLTNIGEARVEERVSRNYSGAQAGLVDEMRIVAKLLVRDILAQKSGTLAVRASEEGASVLVDGVIVGVTPLTPVALAGGAHTIEIEKDGFVRYRQDIEVQSGREVALSANLIPSENFRRAYRSRARRTRMAAWTAIGVGAAALVGGGITYSIATQRSEELRKDIDAYNAPDYARSPEEESRLDDRLTGIANLEVATLVAGGVGLVAIGIGSYLYLSGDDPDRLRRTSRTELHESRDLRLQFGPGWVAVRGRF